ncbi:MAG: acetyltransferase [Deltaproteobacteria bacterium]|nr:acetyltransferase [Deltaproteobacteria bacterium]
MTERVFVFGASGHGKVVIDTVRRAGYDNAIVVDDDPQCRGGCVLGIAVVGTRDNLLEYRCPNLVGIVAIGSNRSRLAVAHWLTEQGFRFLKVIDPTATVSSSALIGEGSLVVAHGVVNAEAHIGKHVIVNTAATVDHDCIVDDGVHLGPGVHLCGGVHIGEGAFIGAGSVVVPGVRVGPWAVVGAGSTVLADLPAGVRAAGSPCRILEPMA